MSSSYLGSPPNMIVLDRHGTDTVRVVRVVGDPQLAWQSAYKDNPVAAACARGLLEIIRKRKPLEYASPNTRNYTLCWHETEGEAGAEMDTIRSLLGD